MCAAMRPGGAGSVRARLEQPEAGPIPERARGGAEELVDRFKEMLEKLNAPR